MQTSYNYCGIMFTELDTLDQKMICATVLEKTEVASG